MTVDPNVIRDVASEIGLHSAPCAATLELYGYQKFVLDEQRTLLAFAGEFIRKIGRLPTEDELEAGRLEIRQRWDLLQERSR